MNLSTWGESPFIIAEMSGNHNGSLDRALAIVEAAAGTGVNAIKLQTYTADTITLDVDTPAFRVSEGHPLWGGKKLYDLYHEAHTPWDWHEPIFNRAKELGILAFSTPFDETAVDFLEDLGSPLYKIASLEIVDIPLIEKTANTGKPVILSTGTATLSEIETAVGAARAAGCEDLTLLVCSSSYPAAPEDVHLNRLVELKRRFAVQVGYSDHTLGTSISLAAVALGAKVIEKHFTLDKRDGGVDSAFSADPGELARIVTESKSVAASLGRSDIWSTPAEFESLRLRPSLYVCEDVGAGDLVNSTNVRSVRPSGGLEPKEYAQALGRRFIRSVDRGTPLSWDLIERV
jgi:N-acetylneuraminate synthase